MGSRYEGEKAIFLDTSPPRTPFLPAQTFFSGQWRSSWHASPSPADRLRRLFPSACTPPIFPRKPHPGAWRAVCAWLTDARRLRLLLGSSSCRFPSCRDQRPVSWHRPSPLSFPSCHRRLPWPEAWPSLLRTAAATPFPFPQKQKAEPPRRAAPLHSGKTEPEATGVRSPDGPSRRSPPGCSRLP